MPKPLKIDQTTHVDLMFPREYMRCVDLRDREFAMKIENIRVEEVYIKTGQPEDRYVLHFVGAEKKLILKPVNAGLIAKALGDGTVVNWIGQTITLYPTTCMFGKNRVDCIRVRDTAPPPRSATDTAPEPDPGADTPAEPSDDTEAATAPATDAARRRVLYEAELIAAKAGRPQHYDEACAHCGAAGIQPRAMSDATVGQVLAALRDLAE